MMRDGVCMLMDESNSGESGLEFKILHNEMASNIKRLLDNGSRKECRRLLINN